MKAVWLLVACVGLAMGCVTRKIDWNSRVGNYTYDQAVLEFGPPDKAAQLTDGVLVAEWLMQRGGNTGGLHLYSHGSAGYITDMPMPDRFIRLTFDKDKRLREWKRVAK